ncbi:MAG: hypothetical protein RLZZ519_2467, partial [Bacteroidota bacterium]
VGALRSKVAVGSANSKRAVVDGIELHQTNVGVKGTRRIGGTILGMAERGIPYSKQEKQGFTSKSGKQAFG